MTFSWYLALKKALIVMRAFFNAKYQETERVPDSHMGVKSAHPNVADLPMETFCQRYYLDCPMAELAKGIRIFTARLRNRTIDHRA
jgi:hypothetical protein